MSKFTRDKAIDIIGQVKYYQNGELLIVSPNIYQGIRHLGALPQLQRMVSFCVNPRLIKDRWYFGQPPAMPLAARIHKKTTV